MEDRFAGKSSSVQGPVEKLPGPTYKGTALGLLVLAEPFAQGDDAGVQGALARNPADAGCFPQAAGSACSWQRAPPLVDGHHRLDVRQYEHPPGLLDLLTVQAQPNAGLVPPDAVA